MLRFALLSLAVVGCIALPAGRILADDATEEVFKHLHKLQEIANKHGSRAVATGYNDSAAYVKEQLLEYGGYDVVEQSFVVPIYEEVTMPTLTIPDAKPAITLNRCEQLTGWQRYKSSCDYAGIRYGGSGKYDITSDLVFVGNACSADNFAGFPKGKLALASAGQCEYYDKGLNAENAGAAGVVLYNDLGVAGSPGGRVFNSATWRETDKIVTIPFVGVTNTIGMVLQQIPGTVVRLQAHTTVKLHRTTNIIADSKTGDKSNVQMIGSHLDGVPEGPGINDNGSGTSTVLALAKRFSGASYPNALRFAWWGAEEIGLLGSRHYVRDLAENHPEELAKIAGYINLDMEASPNAIKLIYNGNELTGPERAGSAALMHLYEQHFDRAGIAYGKTSMTGGSDFLPFILAGLPSSGMATGASGLKSAAERAVHGGLANAALDPCYHAPCDSVDNVDPAVIKTILEASHEVLDRMGNSPAIANRVMLSSSEIVANLAAHRDTTSCISDEERPEPHNEEL